MYTILHPTDAPVRGVLFDMDGVILDTEKLYVRFWAEACQAFGFPMTHTQALGMRSLNPQAGQAYLCSLFGDGPDYQAIRSKRIERMDAYVAEYGIEAKPGICALLDFLHAEGIPCAVTTASPTDRIRDNLGRVGLFDRFDCICSAYQVPHGKPEPDIYLYGAQCLGLPPENCLALEDSYTGLLSAHRAGCMAVNVPDLDPPDQRILDIAHAVADSLTDVIGLVQKQNGFGE